MSKHTPAPWYWADDNTLFSDEFGDIIFSDDDFDRAGSRVSVIAHQEGEYKEANKRLIAAAPELLEAVQAMIEWDDREKDHAVSFEQRMALCEAAFEKARAAIAKAT